MATPKHSNQTITEGIHIVHAFEVADTTARDALSLTSSDVGKIVKVASPLQYDLIVSQSAGVGTYTRIDVARDIDYQAAFQAADLTLTSTNLATDATDLSVTLGVGTWVVEIGAVWDNGITADGYRTDFTFSGTHTSALRTSQIFNNDQGTLVNTQAAEDIAIDFVSTGAIVARFIAPQILTIVVTVAGTLTYRAAKETDVGDDTTFNANNYLIARRKA